MRIYLDLCVYNRPFDDQSQPRIFIEATEFLLILSEVVGRELTLISSFVLEYENIRSPFIMRRDKISDILKVASEYVSYSEKLKNLRPSFS